MAKIRAKAFFVGARERKAIIGQTSFSPVVTSSIARAGAQVVSETKDNLVTGYTLISQSGTAGNVLREELDGLMSRINYFQVQTFKRRSNFGPGSTGSLIPVGLVSYGTDGYGPFYGSLWEFGLGGGRNVSHPRLAALSRAAESVGKGT